MSILSDVDIRRALGRDIVIEPYDPRMLTPIGYDFTVGDFVFSLESGMLDATDDVYSLPSKNTALIITRESLWISCRLGGTFHSKVSLVSKGLSHISTTLDPGWYGPLLITLRNNTGAAIQVRRGDPFVTLILSRLKTPTHSAHNKPPHRRDILLSTMGSQTAGYIEKIANVLRDDDASRQFAARVHEADQAMSARVLASVKNMDRHELKRKGVIVVFYALILALALLSQYWDRVKPYFNNIPYDSKVFVMQITAIIALVTLLINYTRSK